VRYAQRFTVGSALAAAFGLFLAFAFSRSCAVIVSGSGPGTGRRRILRRGGLRLLTLLWMSLVSDDRRTEIDVEIAAFR
jgi:hypothetical protein